MKLEWGNYAYVAHGRNFLQGVIATSSDLELLRQKKALELRKRMLLLQNKQVEPEPKLEPADPRKILSKILTGRAPEVLETARRYYPAEIAELEARLAQAIIAGGLSGPITGEELYSFLRRLGLVFSLDIKIRVREGGKLKSLEEKLRGKD